MKHQCTSLFAPSADLAGERATNGVHRCIGPLAPRDLLDARRQILLLAVDHLVGPAWVHQTIKGVWMGPCSRILRF